MPVERDRRRADRGDRGPIVRPVCSDHQFATGRDDEAVPAELAVEQVRPHQVGDVRRPGRSGEFAHRTPLGDRAALEHHHTVGQRVGVHRVVRDDQARRRPATRRVEPRWQIATHGRPRRRIERSERLVEHDHVGLPDDRPADRHALRLPAGEFGGRAIGDVDDAELFERGERPRVGLASTETARAKAEGDIVASGQVIEQRVVLEHRSDPPLAGGHHHTRARIVPRASVEHDRTIRYREQPDDRPEHRRLAGTVRPDQRDRLAALHAKVAGDAQLADGEDDVDPQRHAPDLATAPTHRPRSPARTAKEIATNTRLTSTARSASTSRARYASSGRVLVTPGRLPAKVIVAPNSPRARAHVSTAPATSAGRTLGNVTLRNTYHSVAPSERAASSARRSSCWKAASTVSTRNGIATNTCATTTAGVENGSDTPNHRSSHSPISPRRPIARKSATPATTGGNTIDRVQIARTRPRPGSRLRASSQASGTPSSTETAVATSEVASDNHNAERIGPDDTTSPTERHVRAHDQRDQRDDEHQRAEYAGHEEDCRWALG